VNAESAWFLRKLSEDPKVQERLERERKRRFRNINRRARAQVMKDLGLVKVRVALGGTYWE